MSEQVREIATLAVTAAGDDKRMAIARLRLRAKMYQMFADAANADGRDGAARVYGEAAADRNSAADHISTA